MNITTEDIKTLREKTSVSIMQCKKALEEAGGDMEKAEILLRKQSAAAASKKADRTLNSGIVVSYIHTTGAMGAMLELLCETDFVAKNADFVQLANDIAMHITAMAPEFKSEADITEDDKVKVRAVFEEEISELNKPEDIKAKILEGKMNDYFAEKTLLNQAFIKNPEITIGKMIEEGIQKIGEKIEIGNWTRMSI